MSPKWFDISVLEERHGKTIDELLITAYNTHGSIAHAAASLGIAPQTFYGLLAQRSIVIRSVAVQTRAYPPINLSDQLERGGGEEGEDTTSTPAEVPDRLASGGGTLGHRRRRSAGRAQPSRARAV